MTAQLVFGTGSARCGSKSLAVLFSAQDGVGITHEEFLLPWDVDLDGLHRAIGACANKPQRQVITQGDPVRWLQYAVPKATIVGDISPVYASYASTLIEQYGARVVCMQRDKDGTVDSFLRQRSDHCSLHPATGEEPDHAQTIPKFDVPTRKEAAEAYWDFFYAKCEVLQGLYPESFRIWPIQALNHDDGQNEILAFAGVTEPRNVTVDYRYTRYACRLFGGDGGNHAA